MVETTIGFLPDEDGILKTFIDRYTTMLIHDSIYLEEHPNPHDLPVHHVSTLSHFIPLSGAHDAHLAPHWDVH